MTSTLAAETHLFKYLRAQLERKFRESPIQVWLDVDGVYTAFVSRLAHSGDFLADVLTFGGSYVDTLLQLDGKLDGLDPKPLLLHLPGHTPDSVRETPFLEVYLCGKTYQKNLQTLTREAAVGLVPQELIASAAPGLKRYAEAEAWLEQACGGDEQTKPLDIPVDDFLYRLLTSPDSVLGRPIEDEDHDALLDYWSLKTGMLPSIAGDLKTRGGLDYILVGWLLLMEYCFDLKRKPTGALAPIKEQTHFRQVCEQALTRVRDTFPHDYCRIALQLETQDFVAQDLLAGNEDELGKIDTFSREDERLFEGAIKRLITGDAKQAGQWAKQRLKGRSIWLKSQPERERLWVFVNACANLGKRLEAVTPDAGGSHYDTLKKYSESLYLVDQAHRHVEQLFERLQTQGEVKKDLFKAAHSMRAAYRSWADLLAIKFNSLCQGSGFLPEADLQQRQLYEQVVHPMVQRRDKVAYLMVDALRYEMAAELAERLKGPEVTSTLTARLAELPTETRVGMNALAPVARDGKLTLKKAFDGFVYDSFVVNDPKQRFRAMGHRSLDPTKQKNLTPRSYNLKELLTSESLTLAAEVKKSHMIVVTSSELDTAGEKDLGFATFDDTLGKLASAVRLLYNAGVPQFVIVADHGFGIGTGEQPRLAYGNGQPTRRYVLGPQNAGADSETVTVSLKELGYQGVEGTLVLPRDTRGFHCPGQNAKSFYHGGNSLQERVIPVLTLDYRERGRVVEKPSFAIKATFEEEMPHWKRLAVTVVQEGAENSQLVLTEAGEKKIRLRFETVGHDCTVQIESPGSGELENGQLIVATEKLVKGVTLKLTGQAESLLISHPDGEYDITTLILPLQSLPPKAAGNWEDGISDGVVLKVLRHLDKHGQISDVEIVELTDNTRAARRFAKSLTPEFIKTLPFRVKVDASQGTIYIKE